jgi:hypothetical protein
MTPRRNISGGKNGWNKFGKKLKNWKPETRADGALRNCPPWNKKATRADGT